jgi:hypothetical protein
VLGGHVRRQQGEQAVDVLRLDRQQQHPGGRRRLGEVDRAHAVPFGQLRGPLRAALDDEDAVPVACLADQTGEERLADLPAADDGQSRATRGDHARDGSAPRVGCRGTG